MKYQFINNQATSERMMQSAVLRLITNNIPRKKTREELISEHEKLEFFGDGVNKYFIHNTCKDKSSLNLQLRISIANLQVGRVPINRFLICRVIARFVKIDALFTLVEDPEGNVERLVLYNWTNYSEKDQSNSFYIDQFFLPVGTQLVIKNLSYQIATDGNTIIHSDNPEDVIVIYRNDDELFNDLKWSTDLKEEVVKSKTVDEFRHCGNEYFALNNYKAAIDEYSGGIKLEPENVTLHSNRAEAYLRLDQFFNALDDTEIALKYEPGHLKAAYRKGKALCGLKRYQEAIITLRDLYQRLSINTNHDIASIEKSTEQLLKHMELLATENEKGQYDFESIIDEYCEKAKIKKDSKGNDVWVNNVGPRLDHADYLIDDIEIGNVKGKGRGWIAKCDIPENTLLMVSKAFKTVYSHEVLGHAIGNTSNKQTESVGSSSCIEELIISVIQKLVAEPYLCRELYQLHDSLDFDKTDKINKKLVNADIIGNIVKYNSFSLANNVIIENTDLSGIGLWILPSYFNHSCVDKNVKLFFLGDLLFIRSLRPISKGEELIISYTGCSSNYEIRSRYLQSVGIDCQCRLCKLDKSESEKTKLRRAQLLNTYKTSIESRISNNGINANPTIIKELEKIIAELRSLRKEHPDLEFDTLEMSRLLSFAYANSANNNKRALSIQKELYDYYKTVYLPTKFYIMLDITITNAALKRMKESMRWFNLAVKAVVEPLIGKVKDDDVALKKKALNLAKKISPDRILAVKRAIDSM
ncbi:hypothetical protein C1645_765374 [Glomus cerebriforme]|uniref:SET domain-containing protein n=1 Tax=Glomus cerebriforme TaxID=658196 RepID=A0A397T200_9GLOM|nr:hypothetical protein C1645_765374 [Glomus cerebriforme]